MGGFFGVTAKDDCISDLFYGTDYHSHLGTKRGGLAVFNKDEGFVRIIHNIENSQFRSKFDNDISRMHSNLGLGVISDYEDQPILMRSHLGDYAIATVGRIQNIKSLADKSLKNRGLHFSELKGQEINPTELVAALINQEESFKAGIKKVQDSIEGSCSLLILTKKGIYAARDRLGRTPVIIGKKNGSIAATLETCSFPNLKYNIDKYLGPGEIVFITPDGYQQVEKPQNTLQICAFLWVYYGFPTSNYEGINVETTRNRCGSYLAKRNPIDIDLVAGIPDSGIAHGIGYSNQAKIPYKRPFIKYTPTWARSFMPQSQEVRNLVARMKLIPITELIKDKRLLFCDDSIVRGTQLKDNIRRLYDCGALEVHMRIACPPLIFGCKFLNFSRSKSELDLAGRWAIQQLEGGKITDINDYSNPETDKFKKMVEIIQKRLNLSSLGYQRLNDLVKAIGLPVEKLCTYCWNGREIK